MHSITWVIKSSKLCNLRCRYCYEMENLASTDRIEAQLFPTLFGKIKEISQHFNAKTRICWHGGEPLLLPVEYFMTALECQRTIFGDSTRPMNLVQTNLTVLDESRLFLLKCFDHVSISLDVIGNLRTNSAGRDSQRAVLKNCAVLKNAAIRFGAISVLTKMNLHDLTSIFRFFNAAQINFRVLPYYRQFSQAQTSEYGLTAPELLGAYKRLLDLWFEEGSGITIKPIDDFVRAALAQNLRQQEKPCREYRYKKAFREFVYVVDTCGDLYSVADTYNPSYCHGNLFRDTSHDLLNSVGRFKAIAEANKRQEATCQQCLFWGACTGFAMGEATSLERYYHKDVLECAVVRPAIEYARSVLSVAPRDSSKCQSYNGTNHEPYETIFAVPE